MIALVKEVTYVKFTNDLTFVNKGLMCEISELYHLMFVKKVGIVILELDIVIPLREVVAVKGMYSVNTELSKIIADICNEEEDLVFDIIEEWFSNLNSHNICTKYYNNRLVERLVVNYNSHSTDLDIGEDMVVNLHDEVCQYNNKYGYNILYTQDLDALAVVVFKALYDYGLIVSNTYEIARKMIDKSMNFETIDVLCM